MLLTLTPLTAVILTVLAALLIGVVAALLVNKFIGLSLVVDILAGVAAFLVFGMLIWLIITSVVAFQPVGLPSASGSPTVYQSAPNQPAAQPAAPAIQQAWSYPLAGQSYSSPQGYEYNAVWTADGRLWQPQLPPGAQRIAHSVAFTIEEGSYAFDGVECRLFVDSSRNGQGSSNPVTAEFGNDLRFVVDTADGGQAWALVECRGNFSSGFQIRWLGPLQ